MNLELEADYKLENAFTFIQGLRTVSRRLRGEIVVDKDQLIDSESLVTGKTIDYDSENEGDLLDGRASGRRKSVVGGAGAYFVVMASTAAQNMLSPARTLRVCLGSFASRKIRAGEQQVQELKKVKPPPAKNQVSGL
eukprot:SAG31_NODE_9775_length_1229_cov_1.273451_2_plen_137_part_00